MSKSRSVHSTSQNLWRKLPWQAFSKVNRSSIRDLKEGDWVSVRDGSQGKLVGLSKFHRKKGIKSIILEVSKAGKLVYYREADIIERCPEGTYCDSPFRFYSLPYHGGHS